MQSHSKLHTFPQINTTGKQPAKSEAFDAQPIMSFGQNFQMSVQPQIQARNVFKLRVCNTIDAPETAATLIMALQHAKPEDQVHLYINSNGGCVDTTVEILNMMKLCEAPIITYACATVASAATLIFLAGDVQVVMDDVSFMCHNYSTWFGGKGNEIRSHYEHKDEVIKSLMNRYYKYFLTPKELTALSAGTDFWFTSAQLAQRVQRRAEKVNEELKIKAERDAAENPQPQLSPVEALLKQIGGLQQPPAV